MRYTDRYLSDLARVRQAVPGLEGLDRCRVLITGAGGLIGSALVDFLLSLDLDIQVYAAGRSVERLAARFRHWADHPGLCLQAYDATRPFESPVAFDYLIHAASPAAPAAYGAAPVETMLANFHGLDQILRFARDTKARRVLYVSSSEVYGRKEGSGPYREEDYGFVDLLDPRSCYPVAKRAAETLCAAYGKEYGVDTVIVRPGHIYGPTATASDGRVSSAFPREVLAGRDIVMKSPGTQLRSYCYVLDCASALVTVLLAGASGHAYNISNKDSVVTIRQMAEAFAQAAGRQVRFADPTAAEAAVFNPMDCSALDAAALEALGWRGLFDLGQGVAATLDAM